MVGIFVPEIISSEKVKPSSPTPLHLKTYKLSMLDQIMMPAVVPIVLYFLPSSNTTHHYLDDSVDHQTTRLLKHSLSRVLTRFYPLAGRLRQDLVSVDCDDEGVPFVVARIKGHKLSDFLSNLNQAPGCLELLSSRLFPRDIACDAEMGPNDHVAMIQLNYFDCGGLAIAAVLCHAVTDGVTVANFLKSWAASAFASANTVACPNYIAHCLFPHKEEMYSQPNPFSGVYKLGKTVMRRYVFDSSAISKLKATVSGFVKRPTRVEVVSALLWKSYMVASLANNYSVSLLSHLVNLRRRAQPPFPSDCFGNFVLLAPATSKNQHGVELGELVKKIRDAISKIDNDTVSRMHGDGGLSALYEHVEQAVGQVSEGADAFSLSSWCGFGFYNDVDFGFGKPVWISKYAAGSNGTVSAFVNVAGLMDTRDGGGIEAWVVLEDKYMAVFDHVEDLQTCATRDLNPLHI